MAQIGKEFTDQYVIIIKMPKSYARKYTPRKYTAKKASTKKPYGGSRYGNDAFVKVEAIESLTPNGGNNQESFATMRVTQPGV